ncbi:DctP family TRAP transporter solute-binding subunit [Salicibibacter halophilus]|uniref:DctP family TRAP transporter solute-binding subunit n=1 Tax=Salicibibacter halophilus TaxID=2502791 RepID=A0A514LKH3_9BACI|nr:DctP family TRAP transporter solute-binding subunit [Salicibibacter halophilus]QDI92303.1 DctP family TRAP transporter solute-binding subunit [Salicibibacter halophilus]
MKRVLACALLCLCFILTACQMGASNAEDDAEYHIRASHAVAQDQSTHLALEQFKETIEDESDERIRVDIYPAGQLYASERSSIEAVQQGNVEMTVTASAPLAGFDSSFLAIDLPFLFDSHEEAYEALDGEFGQTLLERLPDIGLQGLTFAETGMRHLQNNEGPIESPEDMQPLNIRAMENEVHLEMFRAMGANSQPYPFGELYSALQQNVMNAMEGPYNLVYTSSLHEVQDYLTISAHSYTPTIVFMNDDFYMDLPEDLRAIVDDAADDYRDEQRVMAREQDEEAFEVLEEHMEINEWSEEERQVFIDQTAYLYEAFEDEIDSEIMELIEPYRND